MTAIRGTATVAFDHEPSSAASKSSVQGSFTTVLAIELARYFPTAVLNRRLRDKVGAFADLQGGTVLFCGTWSSMTCPST